MLLYLDFIGPLQNHCLFYQSLAKIVCILEFTCKEIAYIGYQSWGGKKSVGCELNINMLISDEMIIYFGSWPKKCIF